MPFDKAFLASLERLARLAKRIGRFARLGRRRRRPRSAAASGEVRDRRDYAAGDDLRYVDWAAFGRLGRVLVKLFESDENREVLLLVDVSASMATGGGAKLEAARRAAAALGCLGIARRDRVSATAFAGGLERDLAPQGGRGALGRLLAFLDGLSPAPRGADPEGALGAFVARREGRTSSHRALALVVSDFLWPRTEPGRAVALLQAAGLDAAFVHVIDPRDEAPELEGAVCLRDAETGSFREVSVDASVIEAYRRAFETHRDALERACVRAGAGYVPVRTDEPVEEAVLDLLRAGALG